MNPPYVPGAASALDEAGVLVPAVILCVIGVICLVLAAVFL